MPTVILVRHGRSDANGSGILAGRTPGVELSETGRREAAALAERLDELPIAALVTSPLERCRQTAAVIGKRAGIKPVSDKRLTECGYGDWTGKKLATLAKDPMWPIVQHHPSAVTFPNGESMRAMQQRGVDAIRDRNAKLAPEAVWVAVTHGDVIKAIVADALALHLDEFQRIVVDTGSATVIDYTPARPFLIRLNDIGGDLAALLRAPSTKKSTKTPKTPNKQSDAVVGGR